MNTQSIQPSRVTRLVKSKWSWGTFILILIGLYVALRILAAINSLDYALRPAKLPKYTTMQTVDLNPKGWDRPDASWFHHVSQGTATIPIPYSWLIALEEPKSSPWLIFLGKKKPYVAEYMLRLGFIGQDKTPANPDGLPVGIAKTESINFAGIGPKELAAGFTCAACHTGQITHQDTRYIIDGGPSMIDLGLFTQTLGAAIGQTALASKFSLFGGRYDRFARNVLGAQYNVLTKARLSKELAAVVKALSSTSDIINVTEGYTRLDALNRIGNQVFSADMKRIENYAPINAPVNYPQIWTTTWFDWVQYDASIMQPLVRNSGEALGVKAYLDTSGPDKQRFASSVAVNNLVEIEKWLGGTHPKENGDRFNGLLAPKWPAAFPVINQELADKGEKLYQQKCKGCHLPPINSEDFWSNKHWQTIKYRDKGQVKETKETFLKLVVIPVEEIGTDPAQAKVLGERTIDTTGLNLNTDVCTPVTDKLFGTPNESGYVASNKPSLVFVPINDSATSVFGLALGAMVERTNEQWFEQNYIPKQQRPDYEGNRPNCLQVGQGYKARPLNGVWSTAPFLHNGSIANIYDLLSIQSERPIFVQLGNQSFDTDKLGIVQNKDVQSLNDTADLKSYELTNDYGNGLFILDTREAGNHNTGHIFDNVKQPGVIGRKLVEEEKLALIEYLKTI